MIRIHAARAVAALFALGLAGASRAADAEHPVVVELFQSQGCSSCPPANASLIEYSRRPDMLALTFAVDYWDRLGWKDTFARSEYTQRQYDYAHSLGDSGVYTPEVIVNGRAAGVGSEVSEVEALARAADRGAGGPSLKREGAKLSVGAGAAPAAGADVWLVVYDPRIVNVPVARGENAGRTLAHRNVVHELVRLGRWSGAAAQLTLPEAPAGFARAVLVQTSGVGPILAAAVL